MKGKCDASDSDPKIRGTRSSFFASLRYHPALQGIIEVQCDRPLSREPVREVEFRYHPPASIEKPPSCTHLVEEASVNYVAISDATLLQVGLSEELAVLAQRVYTRNAPVALEAGAVDVAPSDACSLTERLYRRAYLRYDADSCDDADLDKSAVLCCIARLLLAQF